MHRPCSTSYNGVCIHVCTPLHRCFPFNTWHGGGGRDDKLWLGYSGTHCRRSVWLDKKKFCFRQKGLKYPYHMLTLYFLVFQEQENRAQLTPLKNTKISLSLFFQLLWPWKWLFYLYKIAKMNERLFSSFFALNLSKHITTKQSLNLIGSELNENRGLSVSPFRVTLTLVKGTKTEWKCEAQ